MSWIFNGPGVLQGESKNRDKQANRIEIKAGEEIPDGFLCKETMKYLEKAGKISERKFIDKVIDVVQKNEPDESDESGKKKKKGE